MASEVRHLKSMAMSLCLTHSRSSLNAYDLSCWKELEALGAPWRLEEVGDLG